MIANKNVENRYAAWCEYCNIFTLWLGKLRFATGDQNNKFEWYYLCNHHRDKLTSNWIQYSLAIEKTQKIRLAKALAFQECWCLRVTIEWLHPQNCAIKLRGHDFRLYFFLLFWHFLHPKVFWHLFRISLFGVPFWSLYDNIRWC